MACMQWPSQRSCLERGFNVYQRPSRTENCTELGVAYEFSEARDLLQECRAVPDIPTSSPTCRKHELSRAKRPSKVLPSRQRAWHHFLVPPWRIFWDHVRQHVAVVTGGSLPEKGVLWMWYVASQKHDGPTDFTRSRSCSPAFKCYACWIDPRIHLRAHDQMARLFL